MSNKKLIYFGLAIIALVIILIMCFQNITLVADKLSLTGILINVLIAILAVTYFQNRESNSRSLKNYFINEISYLKKDYDNFIDNIKSDKLNSNKIKKRFKEFSIKNNLLEDFLKKELGIKNTYIQKKNREIHQLVTESYEFNSIYDNSLISLSNEDNNKIIKVHKELNYHLMSLIVKINKI